MPLEIDWLLQGKVPMQLFELQANIVTSPKEHYYLLARITNDQSIVIQTLWLWQRLPQNLRKHIALRKN